jgi:hypothetical protein
VDPGPRRQRLRALIVVATAAVLVVTGVLLALLLAGGGSGTEQPTGDGVLPTAPAVVPTTGRQTATRRAPTRAVWPIGATAWTAVVATLAKRNHTRAAAETLARRLHVPGLRVRVFDSSLHPRLRPGTWIVFAGRFATRAAATRAARRLQAAGATRAVAERLTG